MLDPEHTRSVYGENIFNPVMVMDGKVCGTWQRTFHKGTVSVTAQPFAPFSPEEEAAFGAQAGRFAEFMGVERVESRDGL
jgi:hypothetical protein